MMKRFHNILFVSSGIRDEIEVLRHALKLAYDNQAHLEILIVCPQFPKSFAPYQASYEAFLQEHINKNVEKAKAQLANKKNLTIKIEVEWDNSPDIKVIQRVLRHGHDLVIKEVEYNDSPRGFHALDMGLLRKCPCALYLHRPFKHAQEIRVAVAIDPENETPSAQDLALNLLNLGHSLADHYKGQVNIISCWDLALESFLRKNAWMEIPEDELDHLILHEGNTHYLALNKLIKEAKIDKPKTYHVKGDPTELIPAIITDKHIDVLVMGTIARTGIAGFVIGNTAENILQKIDCSLWALKPQGFVSPVKAY